MELVGQILVLWIVGGSTALLGMIGRGSGRMTPMPVEVSRREP